MTFLRYLISKKAVAATTALENGASKSFCTLLDLFESHVHLYWKAEHGNGASIKVTDGGYNWRITLCICFQKKIKKLKSSDFVACNNSEYNNVRTAMQVQRCKQVYP